MARKGADDLLAELDSLGVDEQPTATASQANSSKPRPVSVLKPQEAKTEDDDVLADLQAQLAAKPSQSSRPSTPRLSSSTTSGTNKSPKRADHTPASSGPPSGRNSEDRLRNMPNPAQERLSGEGSRRYHQGYTPATSEEEPVAQAKAVPAPAAAAGGGGWWGSVYSAATAAVKQAETLAKEISSNEEAQRWAEQVKGGVSNLQSFGTVCSCLQNRSTR